MLESAKIKKGARQYKFLIFKALFQIRDIICCARMSENPLRNLGISRSKDHNDFGQFFVIPDILLGNFIEGTNFAVKIRFWAGDQVTDTSSRKLT
jgi:hypothetical protein